MILTTTSMTILLDWLGHDLFSLIFREVPFTPYIRLAIWISFFNVLGLLPLNLLQIQERPGSYVLFSIVGTLLSMTIIVGLVIFQKQGAYGYLLGTLLASILMAAPYLVLTLRQVRIRLKWDVLKAAMIFSLPLIPHGLAGWVLELSDRVILERYVTLGELGLYAVSYQLGVVMNVAAAAINNAWSPFLFKTDAEKGDAAKPNLARLATYYTLVLSWTALGISLLAKDILLLLTAPAYHTAYRVTSWIVWGLLLAGLYYIPMSFLFLKSKTGWVPIVTVISGLVNVSLNLWLVPSHGIMAAAWATFLSYGIMLLLVWRIALRIYPFPYEYRRLGLIALAVISLSALGTTIQFDSVGLNLGVKGSLLMIYPVALFLLGFFTPAERGLGLAFIRQALMGLRTMVVRRV
jgi:O-antigen/teichoic acid export membrane protein